MFNSLNAIHEETDLFFHLMPDCLVGVYCRFWTNRLTDCSDYQPKMITELEFWKSRFKDH